MHLSCVNVRLRLASNHRGHEYEPNYDAIPVSNPFAPFGLLGDAEGPPLNLVI